MLALTVQVDQVAGVLISLMTLVLESLPVMCIRGAGKEDTDTDQSYQYQRAHHMLLGFLNHQHHTRITKRQRRSGRRGGASHQSVVSVWSAGGAFR